MPADDVLPWKLLLSKLRRSDDSRVSYDEVLRTGWQPEVLVVRERVLEYGKADDYEPRGCLNGCLPNVNYDLGAAEGLVAVACPEEPSCWPGWTMVPRTEVEALRCRAKDVFAKIAATNRLQPFPKPVPKPFLGVGMAMLHGAPGAHGWGTAISTDTAFVLGGLALLGTRVPVTLRLFILSLAVIDDVGAILIVAVVYGGALSWPALAVAGGVVVLVLVLARAGFRTVPLYVLAGGVLWFAIEASGVHPSIAGVLLGLMTPAREWVSGVSLHRILERVVGSHPTAAHQRNATERDELQTAAIAAREAISPVERIELRLHPWSAFLVMPVFALANAGVQLSWEKLVHPVSVAVATALVVGKPVGVIAVCWLAERARFGTRPADLSWSVIAAASVLTGIGFTMSIFIAGLAFEAATLDAAKVGILSASLLSGSGGLVLLFFLTKRRRHGLVVSAEPGSAKA